MKSATKKVIIWVVCVVIVAAIAITAALAITAYNKAKPERLIEDLQSKLTQTWTGDNEISSLGFDGERNVKLVIFGVELNGIYTLNYNEETAKYSMYIQYDSSIGLSVKRNFDVYVSEIDGTLTLVDQESGIRLVYSSSGSSIKTNPNIAPTTTTTTSQSSSQNQADDLAFAQALCGKWQGTTLSVGGYEFFNDGSVNVNLLSASLKGSYTISAQDDGKTRLKISYVSVAGATISNSYYASITENTLNLEQVGYESISLKYTRVIN